MNRSVIATIIVATIIFTGGVVAASTASQPVSDLEFVTAEAGDDYYRIVADNGISCTDLALHAANGRTPLDRGTAILIPPSCRSQSSTTTTAVEPTATQSSTTTSTVEPTATQSSTMTTTTVAPTATQSSTMTTVEPTATQSTTTITTVEPTATQSSAMTTVEPTATQSSTTTTTTVAPTTTTRPTTTTTAPAPSSTIPPTTSSTTLPPAPTTTQPSDQMHDGPYVDRTAIPAAGTGFDYPIIESATYAPRRSHDGVGAFRTNCTFSHMNFDDAIVFPGQRNASHLHTYFGATGVDASTTNPTSSPSSTCNGGTDNRSAYWHPAIIDTNTGTPVVPVGENALQAYYKTGYRGVANTSIRSMPEGLRMIAGNVNKTTLDGNTWGPLKYHCLSSVAFNNFNAYTETFPNCQPGDTLVMTIDFPQCWNGRDLDSPDHKSHMAYGQWGPTQGQNGAGCPSSHPVAIPEITANFRYLVPAGGMSTWRFSSDHNASPAGLSGHADWWNGWDSSVFDIIRMRCLNLDFDCQMNLTGDGRHLGRR